MIYKGVINGKAGKTAALPKFSDTLTLSQSRGADYTHFLGEAMPMVGCYPPPLIEIELTYLKI